MSIVTMNALATTPPVDSPTGLLAPRLVRPSMFARNPKLMRPLALACVLSLGTVPNALAETRTHATSTALLQPAPARAQEENELLTKLNALRASFELRSDEYEAYLALAIEDIREGRLNEGIAALQLLVKAEMPEDIAARVGRELARATAWDALTRKYLNELVSSGNKLKLTVDGQKLQAKVTAVEASLIKLGSNKLGRDELELSALTPMVVVDLLKSKINKYGPGWLRLYPYALTANAKVKSLLNHDKSEEVVSMKEDAKSSYTRLAVIANSARTLADLAKGTWPTSGGAAGDALTVIARMRETRATDAMFTARSKAMTAFARYALDIQFSSKGIASLIKGKVEAIEDGKIRVTYDFEDEDALDDFDIIDRFIMGPRNTRPQVELPSEETGIWIEEGDFVSLGAVAAKHKLQWDGPIKLSYDLAFKQHESFVTNITEFCMGFNGVLDSSFVWCRNMGHLNVANRKPLWGKMGSIEGGAIPEMNRRYDVVVETDAKDAWTIYKGKEVARISIGPRTSGFLFIWIHSSAQARIGTLVVEGRLEQEAVRDTKAKWMAAQMKELRFDV
ncbi:MAG: hypothetical protein ACI841_002553 [Planctomycetota bacterium]|jgi:hypothetical protein